VELKQALVNLLQASMALHNKEHTKQIAVMNKNIIDLKRSTIRLKETGTLSRKN